MATLSITMANGTTSAFPCPTCGQELSRRGDLKRHIAQLHPTGNEQLWKCPHCPYQHVQKSNVKIHAEKHELKRTGERPHTCPEPGCTAAYQDKGLLTRHRKKKHGYQPNHSPRYLEKKGLYSSADSITTSRLSSEEGETSPYVHQVYEAPPSPPESISTAGDVTPLEVHAREENGAGMDVSRPTFESLQTASAKARSDVACQSESSPASSTLRLPPISKLFKKADDLERKRPPSSFVPRFPGPLIVGHRRPASAQGHLGFHAPQPGYFQRLSDPTELPLTATSSVTRERRPSSTPCLPTPPAFQTTFPSSPSPNASQDRPSVVPKVLESTRTPISFTRQQRRPAPYPVARGNNLATSDAPRWHKWWMAPDAASLRVAHVHLVTHTHSIRSH